MIEERLLTDITGRVIRPGDDNYDAARQVVLGGIDRRPSAIVRVADATDVARVIRFARETGTELAVRSGGHSGAGHSTTEGGVVIDLRDLRALEVDPAARTVTAQTGLTAYDLAVATAEHGLAIGFGDTGTVGIGGITLGGGIGYLSRRDGLTIDNLLAAEIVTADGEVLEVDADNHPDLFWAIRGGGGNFGVATRFTYRLSELDRIVGGMLVLPATSETVAGYMAAAAEAPDELSTIANVMSCPPMPFIPEEHHDRPVIMGILAWSGDVAEGGSPHRAVPSPRPGAGRPGHRDRLPGPLPARGGRGRLPPARRVGDDVHARDRRVPGSEHRRRPSRPRMHRCGSRSSARWAVPSRASLPMRPRSHIGTKSDHGQRRLVLRRTRRPASATGLDRLAGRRARPGRDRRLRQLRERRGARAGP